MAPDMWKVLEIPDNGASIHNFRIAAGREKGPNGTTPFGDGDFYKWLEAVAHLYATRARTRPPDGRDLDVIAHAQGRTGTSRPHQIAGKQRWQRFGDLSYTIWA
jgi:hypothetical protein